MHYFTLGLPAEPFRARASLFTPRGVLLGDNISAPRLSSSSSIQVPGVGVFTVLVCQSRSAVWWGQGAMGTSLLWCKVSKSGHITTCFIEIVETMMEIYQRKWGESKHQSVQFIGSQNGGASEDRGGCLFYKLCPCSFPSLTQPLFPEAMNMCYTCRHTST